MRSGNASSGTRAASTSPVSPLPYDLVRCACRTRSQGLIAPSATLAPPSASTLRPRIAHSSEEAGRLILVSMRGKAIACVTTHPTRPGLRCSRSKTTRSDQRSVALPVVRSRSPAHITLPGSQSITNRCARARALAHSRRSSFAADRPGTPSEDAVVWRWVCSSLARSTAYRLLIGRNRCAVRRASTGQRGTVCLLLPAAGRGMEIVAFDGECPLS